MKRILSTALAIVLFVGASQAQTTEEGKGRRHGKGGEMYKELSLTEEQKAKLKSIREAEKKEMDALKADRKTEADKAARKQVHDKYKSQLDAVLTAEQKAKLDVAKKEGRAEGFGKGHRGDMNGRMAEDLNLSADQKTKLSSVNSDFKTKADAIRKNESLSNDEKKTQMKTLAETHKKSITSILTPEQAEKMKTMHKGKGKRNKSANL